MTQEYVDPHKSLREAEAAVQAINPQARVTRIWMGDNWPGAGMPKLRIMFVNDSVLFVPMDPNPGADSIVEFSDGHMVVVRHEQDSGNHDPRFGKARRRVGVKGGGTGKAGRRRKARSH